MSPELFNFSAAYHPHVQDAATEFDFRTNLNSIESNCLIFFAGHHPHVQDAAAKIDLRTNQKSWGTWDANLHYHFAAKNRLINEKNNFLIEKKIMRFVLMPKDQYVIKYVPSNSQICPKAETPKINIFFPVHKILFCVTNWISFKYSVRVSKVVWLISFELIVVNKSKFQMKLQMSN